MGVGATELEYGLGSNIGAVMSSVDENPEKSTTFEASRSKVMIVLWHAARKKKKINTAYRNVHPGNVSRQRMYRFIECGSICGMISTGLEFNRKTYTSQKIHSVWYFRLKSAVENLEKLIL